MLLLLAIILGIPASCLFIAVRAPGLFTQAYKDLHWSAVLVATVAAAIGILVPVFYANDHQHLALLRSTQLVAAVGGLYIGLCGHAALSRAGRLSQVVFCAALVVGWVLGYTH